MVNTNTERVQKDKPVPPPQQKLRESLSARNQARVMRVVVDGVLMTRELPCD